MAHSEYLLVSNRPWWTFWVQNSFDSKRTREMQLSVWETLASNKQDTRDSDSENSNLLQYCNSNDSGANFDARMRRQILRKITELGDEPSHPTSLKNLISLFSLPLVQRHQENERTFKISNYESQLYYALKLRSQSFPFLLSHCWFVTLISSA